jgi:hypothetical protein
MNGFPLEERAIVGAWASLSMTHFLELGEFKEILHKIKCVLYGCLYIYLTKFSVRWIVMQTEP